jgi:hypothetical protein
MFPVEITTQFYTVPVFDFDVLEVKTSDSSSSYSKEVAPKEIEVPVGGVEVHFKTGGGQECAPCYFITTSFQRTPLVENLSPAELELHSGFEAAKAKKIKMDADMEIAWALRKSIVNAEPAAIDSPLLLEEPKTAEETAEYVEKLRLYMSAVAK